MNQIGSFGRQNQEISKNIYFFLYPYKRVILKKLPGIFQSKTNLAYSLLFVRNRFVQTANESLGCLEQIDRTAAIRNQGWLQTERLQQFNLKITQLRTVNTVPLRGHM